MNDTFIALDFQSEPDGEVAGFRVHLEGDVAKLTAVVNVVLDMLLGYEAAQERQQLDERILATADEWDRNQGAAVGS